LSFQEAYAGPSLALFNIVCSEMNFSRQPTLQSFRVYRYSALPSFTSLYTFHHYGLICLHTNHEQQSSLVCLLHVAVSSSDFLISTDHLPDHLVDYQLEQYNGISMPCSTDTLHSSSTNAAPHIPPVPTVDAPQSITETLAGLITRVPPVSDVEAMGSSTTCLHHGPIIALARSDEQPQQELGVMERYDAEAPAKQCWAIMNKDGQSYTYNVCTCVTVGPELVIQDEAEELAKDKE
jgi:hypothetical protein